jgi:hypothetical protein
MTDEAQPTVSATVFPTTAFGQPLVPPPPPPFPVTPSGAQGDQAPKVAKQPATGDVAEAITLLQDAKERLAVNSLSDVGYFIGRAITLLGGPNDAGD